MIEIHGGIKNLSAEPDIAFQYQPNGQPWSSVASAHAGTPSDYRAIGKIRFIDDGTGLKEYWYRGGIDIANLLPRYEVTGNVNDAIHQLFGVTSTRSRAQIRALNGNTESLISISDLPNNCLAVYRQGDTETPDDNITMLVTTDGRRYQIIPFAQIILNSISNNPLA